MDRILVFDEGKIVEDGAYDDLIAISGGYLARFHAVQSEDDLSPADEPEERMDAMGD
ncbi:MAG: hypothetical protein RLN89_02805 [Parvibaculum sp.]